MKIQLDVPDSIDFQLVYRMDRDQPFRVQWRDGFQFVLLDAPQSAIRYQRALKSAFGTFGAAKTVAKLATAARCLYMVVRNGVTEAHGWCMNGRCAYYKIEPNAVVIGPILTAPTARGKGLAGRALQAAINEHMRRGKSTFYIDTSQDNYPAQRVFAKCGFGDPVAVYFRGFR